MIKRVLLSPLLICSILLPVIGQQPRPQPTPEPAQAKPAQPQNPSANDQDDVVRITTNLVQVDVSVTKDDKPVTDLQAEDFEILEDDKPQTISNFSYVSNLPETAAAGIAPARSKDKDAPLTPPVPPAKINPNEQRRTIALVVDDLGLSFDSMSNVRTQIKKFLDKLPSNDLVAIIRTGGDVGSLQQFTNDRRVLQGAADRLRWNQCSRAGLSVFPRLGDPGGGAGICAQSLGSTLKALRFIVRGMSYLPGRKSMVLFSDYVPIENQEPIAGVKSTNQPDKSDSPLSDAPSMPESERNYYGQLQRLAELAIRSAVVIYAVDTRGLQTTGLSAADAVNAPSSIKSNMNAINNQVAAAQALRSLTLLRGREGSDLIAKQTGGFLVHNSNNFELDRVMEDQQGYYLIGFRPKEETFDRKFHHLKVRLKRKGLTVRTRAGFYGLTDEESHPAQLSVADQMNKALLSPFGANEVTVNLTTLFVDDPAQGPRLRSFLYLDPKDLTFTEEAGGWHVAKLELRGALFGDNGRVMGQQDQAGTVRFRGAGYERALRDGIVYGFDTPVKQRGAFQFRVAVRDVGSSHIGAAGQFVEVPDLHKGELALSGIFAREAVTERKTTAVPGKSAPDDEDELVTAGPGVRRFRLGAKVLFAYAIYNANVGSPGSAAQLTRQTRIFRDGKAVFSGDPMPVSLEGQTDLRRITSATLFNVGTEMQPGQYIVQIIVTDSSKQKSRIASQWIDFEVLK